ncbi:TetR/AcrR family transcriptional regulator [Microterricola viridarii]|uniref:DNA-binding transcriptional regulator, AcrR family n=1 Tax=Microterricola viridarii TaxID=412690 RepID=A0A1H1LEQ7_9MICO|nr:TetR/AcrR family transcriptional regulator [Microterricola viridarii]SDR73071.1 DNA-binding transcriptional regulator, AcrR family [Microterricola viridarii]
MAEEHPEQHPEQQPGNPDGLRARKRAATRAAIEEAALALSLEHGYDNVTVDMICAASMISQRTFFNYFGSKEGFAKGLIPAAITDADAERFLADRSDDVLGALAQRMAHALMGGAGDGAWFEARMRVFQSSSELTGKWMEWLADQEQLLVDLVLARFAADGRTTAADPELVDEAKMVVSLAIGVLRFTMQQRQAQGASAPPLEETVRHATALVGRIAGRA